MAEYYKKLKDPSESRKNKIKKILSSVLLIALVVFCVLVMVGIFGDTKRRDETRDIIIENAELKQQIYELTKENEELTLELSETKKLIEQEQTGAVN